MGMSRAGGQSDRASDIATKTGEPGLLTTVAAERSPSGGHEGIAPGMVLGDRYRIEAPLGAGGMGIVYLAEHIAIGKPVAIKVLGSDYLNRKPLVERFMQEARAASSIRHENIVDITDFGHVRDGVPYFVMEYLQGETLAQRLRRSGPMPWRRARSIMLQICAALKAAHDGGVIHRDMKPDNCFLVERRGSTDFVKVLDFGIAKIVTEGASKNLTQTGVVMGTASYMSPEQAQSLELDARTDVYSAGVVFYEMLAGRVPFRAQGFLGMLTKHLTEAPPPLRRVAPEAEIPVEVERVVMRALVKDRDDRHASAEALAEALRAIPADATGRARRAWVFGAALAAVVIAGAGVMASASVHDGAEVAPAIVAVNDAPAIATPPEAKGEVETPAVVEPEVVEPEVVEPVEEELPSTEPEPAPEPEPEARRKATPRTKAVKATRDAGDIDRGLRRARKRAVECGREHGGLPGRKVEVSFTIDPAGKVSTAKADRLHEGLPLGRCVVNAVKTATFPRALEATDAVRKLAVHT